MNQSFQKLYEHLPIEAQELLFRIDEILHQSVDQKLDEKIWSKMPMYYSGSRTIILALFSDHINIVSNPAIYKSNVTHPNAILKHKNLLGDYKITPKGMLQIFVGDEIPKSLLTQIFVENFDETHVGD